MRDLGDTMVTDQFYYLFLQHTVNTLLGVGQGYTALAELQKRALPAFRAIMTDAQEIYDRIPVTDKANPDERTYEKFTVAEMVDQLFNQSLQPGTETPSREG